MRRVRAFVILAFTLLAFILLTDRLGVVFAVLVGFPFGWIMGVIAGYVDRWIND